MKLQTFTTDALEGYDNEELKDIINKYEPRIKKLCEDFVIDCNAKNVEVSSANGWMNLRVLCNLLNARFDLCIRKIEDGSIMDDT